LKPKILTRPPSGINPFEKLKHGIEMIYSKEYTLTKSLSENSVVTYCNFPLAI
jgi:hypothetical protein